MDTRLTYSVVCPQRKIKITLLILRIMSFGGGITSAVYQSLDSMKLLTTAAFPFMVRPLSSQALVDSFISFSFVTQVFLFELLYPKKSPTILAEVAHDMSTGPGLLCFHLPRKTPFVFC